MIVWYTIIVHQTKIIIMNKIYIVPAYGIPKNILLDEHYNRYLQGVFNYIFDHAQGQKALIIFTGGNSDMVKPYRRTEAGETKRLFDVLMKRPFVKKAVQSWKIITEKSALSSVENLVNTKKVFLEKKITFTTITVFSEWSRQGKMKVLAKKIFGRGVVIHPIDFDISQNRYHTELAKKREAEDIRLSLWALKNSSNFKRYNKVFQDRITWLRIQKTSHPEAVKKWTEMKLKELGKTK